MALAINFKWILSSCREKYIIYLALMCNFLKSILPGGSHTGARNMRISPAYCKCSRLRTLWENKKPTILRPFLERNLSLCDNTIIIIIYTIVMASRECCLLLSDSCFGRLCRMPLQTYAAGALKAKRLLESYTTHTSAEREFFLLYGKHQNRKAHLQASENKRKEEVL